MTTPPGRRESIDFPGGDLGGVKVPDDGSGGLVWAQVNYPEPNIPTILSPGNQRKEDMGSERN